MQLRIAGIARESVVDGPGFRFVIFTQGCPHHCEGCHNPKTHAEDGGTFLAVEDIFSQICATKLISGVTFSGGEPFMQAGKLVHLAKKIRSRGLDIVTYTGFLFEQLLAMASQNKDVRQLLSVTDLLVDGPYIAAERDLRLAFRGSRNQRIIDVASSLALGKVVLWEDKTVDCRRRA